MENLYLASLQMYCCTHLRCLEKFTIEYRKYQISTIFERDIKIGIAIDSVFLLVSLHYTQYSSFLLSYPDEIGVCYGQHLVLRMNSMYAHRLILGCALLGPGASVCSACSSSSCTAGLYLSGCGGSSAGACALCPSGSFSISPGKRGLCCGQLFGIDCC